MGLYLFGFVSGAALATLAVRADWRKALAARLERAFNRIVGAWGK